MNECGIVGFISSDNNEDESLNYDSALEIEFGDSNYSDDFMDERMDNLIENNIA